MKARKKPLVIDAWRVEDLLAAAKSGGESDHLPNEVRLGYDEGLIEFEANHITIVTLEGTMIGLRGWWLLRGVQGEFYPCEGTVFDETYDMVTEVAAGQWHVIERVAPEVPGPYDYSPEV